MLRRKTQPIDELINCLVWCRRKRSLAPEWCRQFDLDAVAAASNSHEDSVYSTKHARLLDTKFTLRSASHAVTDTLTTAERSHRMSLVRGKDTKPEKLVRSMVHGLGFRYRLHVKGMPGRPDMVLARLKAIIEVRGCFWHRHANCSLARLPKSRQDFWVTKLQANAARDLRNEQSLLAEGWRILIIWECETKYLDALRKKLGKFLNDKR
jgi:DNA mismatch endonuclease (patch repair protein)